MTTCNKVLAHRKTGTLAYMHIEEIRHAKRNPLGFDECCGKGYNIMSILSLP